MHETGIAQNIIDIARAYKEKNDCKEITIKLYYFIKSLS